MIDPKKVDFNQIPKKFCDGALGAYGRDLFSFGLTSGNNIDSFATTPQIMKSISIWLKEQIDSYEKSFGEIMVKAIHPPAVKRFTVRWDDPFYMLEELVERTIDGDIILKHVQEVLDHNS